MICIALCTFAEPHQSMEDDKGALFTLGVSVECAASLFALGQTELGRGCTFAYRQAYYTAQAKQSLIEDILKVKDLEGIVFVDGDVAFSPLDFKALVEDGREMKGVLGGFYPSRQVRNQFIGTPVDPDPELCFTQQPVEAVYLGFGFLWAPAALFKAMPKPWVSTGIGPGGKFEMEDQYFSRKVRETTDFRLWIRHFDGLSHEYRTRRNMSTLMVQGGM